ncbi:indolepyruvate oxidoreductase subunit beta family protein [Hoeflea sp. TYP-13]|uniref:indolepyruvate oxidoreductase subunit beta family protein n=1 Tax=Hoeflea sp. TYP-13 TaxID=3230023 RepID=UPI0034C697DA
MNVGKHPQVKSLGVKSDGVDTTGDIIKLAMLAVGGQGGGVLSDWIIDVAESNGYRAQSTSVAGVAQRTGATIYYVEMTPDTGREPVFSLTPAPGDVDIMIAAELMEAGRSILRGFVTPDRTTLIMSSHRILAVSEKMVPGDGRRDSSKVIERAQSAAKKVVAFDMEREALDAGTVISASLFGALAGSGALPFLRESYEETIRAGGRGVDASLAAFGACFEKAASSDGASLPGVQNETSPDKPAPRIEGPSELLDQWNALTARTQQLPDAVQPMALAGLHKVVDYQDVAYGDAYLEQVERAVAADSANRDWKFSTAAAKYVANAMVYDDIIRVADLKLRSARTKRVRDEVGAGKDTILNVTEYFHPRAQEVCGTLPAGLGLFIENRPTLFRLLDRLVNRGRRIRTDSLTGYFSLWVLAALKPVRRRLRRHTVEADHRDKWFAQAMSSCASDYDLGVEVLNCRRLIKGYSDTHARGQSKFDLVMSALDQLAGKSDPASLLRHLREVALAEEGTGSLETELALLRT